jgi:putative tryptophan/tyrosine transport system substrate-binding protein
MHRQVGALREVLSQQAIGVLVRAALPRTLRIAKINIDIGRQRKATMIRRAARDRLPAMYDFSIFAVSGGLISYGTDLDDANRLMGINAGRILKGEKPSELPVMQPTKFELVINVGTAKTLGLTVPPTLLAQADEVVE